MSLRGSAVLLIILSGSVQAQPTAADADRSVSWSRVVPNIGRDQKQIWTSPFRTHSKRMWVGASLVIGLAAGMVAIDAHEARYFRDTNQYNEFNEALNTNATQIGILMAPAALYLGGAFSKDSKMRTTALLAGEAIASSAILETAMKAMDRRVRPMNIPASGNYWDSWFESRGSITGGRSSFPSGHAITAFAVATVVSRRYSNHRWVAPVAYGVAGLIDFSRLTLSAHYLSDVFIGSALGYSVGRFVVLRQ